MPIISISVLSGPGIFTSGSWGFGVVRLLGAGDVHLELAKIAPTPEKRYEINNHWYLAQRLFQKPIPRLRFQNCHDVGQKNVLLFKP